jgi:hypothetical protein
MLPTYPGRVTAWIHAKHQGELHGFNFSSSAALEFYLAAGSTLNMSYSEMAFN